MIRVQVTERLLFEAEDIMGVLEGADETSPRYKPSNMMLGAIGEMALIDYCWKNDLLAYKREGMSSDVQLHSGHTIEVKTQKVNNEPKNHYRVNFASYQLDTENSDFMFFTHLQFVNNKPEAVWLLGGCSRDKFWRLSKRHLTGEPMMNHYEDGNEIPSGRYFTQDVNVLPISQLAPPSATLKHFKQLQTKEESK